MIARPESHQRRVSCDRTSIQRLLRDELNEVEMETVSEHLSECDSCRALLDSDTLNDANWNGSVSSVRACLTSTETTGADHATRSPAKHPASLTSWLKACSFDQKQAGYIGTLDRYLIRRVVGTGGMGVVFEGWDDELHRPVAIKAMHPHLAAIAIARQRFIREARAAAAIVHANVVPIHSVHAENDPPYFVMPLISGESLQSRLDRQGSLEVDAALRVASQVADGLAAAHDQGLVHRDIKPANILVEYGTERAMITDFGVVRALDDATMTVSGGIAGTPEFMSPEQTRGDAIDHRSDLFSLGSVLYAMLVGRSPFRADSPMGVLRRVSDDRPRPIREVYPRIPIWMESIVSWLHEKDVTKRPSSAVEVAALLRDALSHWNDPINHPVPISTPRVISRRMVWLTAACVGSVLIALLVWSFVGWTQRQESSLDSSIAESETTVSANMEDSQAEEAEETQEQVANQFDVDWGVRLIDLEISDLEAIMLDDLDELKLNDVEPTRKEMNK